MAKSTTDYLIELSEVDQRIALIERAGAQIEEERQAKFQELELRRSRLRELESLHQEAVDRQKGEEEKLRTEEQKIVERRKQLTAIGGAKMAKVMEREIDIASRSLKTLEETAMKVLEDADSIAVELESLRPEVEKMELEFETQVSETDKTLETNGKDAKDLEKQRTRIAGKVPDPLTRLYDRVSRRYKGDAVAIASEGSCRSCYRALPSQLYNQVLAGEMMIQCPGCSRILVYKDK